MSGASPARHDRGVEIRVLHWNIHSWREPKAGASNLSDVVALVGNAEPDVVSLVEVNERWDGEAGSALAELAAATGYSPLFAPAFEYGSDGSEGGFGNALLSRLPILAMRQRQLTWPDTVYTGDERSEPRSLVLAKVGVPGGSDSAAVWVGSTHLPWQDAASRAGALGRLRGMAAGLDAPWLICGDFNLAADEWVDGVDDLAVAPFPAAPTCPADKPAVAIDYCVAAPGAELTGEVLDVAGSDHRPVLVRWRLPGAASIIV
jgi:endonuclease/exonuclease/phosphatase family metal-dependent hydrolase